MCYKNYDFEYSCFKEKFDINKVPKLNIDDIK